MCVIRREQEITQRSAIVSLEAYDELAVRVDALVTERGRLLKKLRDLGYAILDAQENFMAATRRAHDRIHTCRRASRCADVIVHQQQSAMHCR